MSLSLRGAARDAPERTALVVGGRAVSFRELARRVERRLAPLDRELSAAPDVPFVLVGSSDLDSLETFYALLELEHPAVLVHPRLGDEERSRLLSLISGARLSRAEAEGRAGRDERALAILFTSGTEGTPRGVVLSRRAFLSSADASAVNLGWRDDDRWLLALPIAHVGGLSILTRCLLARKTVVVPAEVERGARLEVDSLARAVEEDRVTLLSLVPTQLEWLLAREPAWTPPPHLRAVLLGGAAARPALLSRAANRGVPVLTTYGLTEACSQVTTQSYGTVNRGEHGAGTPIAGTEVRIDAGRIRVRGPTLLSGYFPDSVPSPLDGDGWLATGDLGRIDDAGRLHVLGRASDLIVTGGENVAPAEVEAALEEHPGVRAACVFGVPDDTWGDVVAAAVVTSGPPLDAAALGAWIRGRLAPHRRPRRIAFVPELVVNASGKVDRRATARAALPVLAPLPGV